MTTHHHDEAIELNVIETVDEDINTGLSPAPKICIDLSPALARRNTDDTIDTDFPQTPSPRMVFPDFSSGKEANIRDNIQSNNLITDKAFLTPTFQRRGVSIRKMRNTCMILQQDHKLSIEV